MPLELLRMILLYIGDVRVLAGFADGSLQLMDPSTVTFLGLLFLTLSSPSLTGVFVAFVCLCAVRNDNPAFLNGHKSAVYCLTLLNDGRLATGSTDGTIRLWIVGFRECVATVKGRCCPCG
jgi:WD40 repeat protein